MDDDDDGGRHADGVRVMARLIEFAGLTLCGLGAVCMLVALAVDLDSTAARLLMALAAAFFVPGALLTLAWVRWRMGPPR